jgi:hypothetical protein
MHEIIELHCDKDVVEGRKRSLQLVAPLLLLLLWRFCSSSSPFCGFPSPLALRYSLAPLQTDPRFLGLLKAAAAEEEEEEEPPVPFI